MIVIWIALIGGGGYAIYKYVLPAVEKQAGANVAKGATTQVQQTAQQIATAAGGIAGAVGTAAKAALPGSIPGGAQGDQEASPSPSTSSVDESSASATDPTDNSAGADDAS